MSIAAAVHVGMNTDVQGFALNVVASVLIWLLFCTIAALRDRFSVQVTRRAQRTR